MAIEFNITTTDHFFLGEDKIISFSVFGPDGVTPLDVSSYDLVWTLRKTDKSADAILTKTVGNGLEVVGAYDADPAVNTQRVHVLISSDETDPEVTTAYTLKTGVAYRHSLKRMNAGNEIILSFGSITFLQATVR